MPIYEVTSNSDLTEGRGHEVSVAYLDNLDEAVKIATNHKIKIMGVGDVANIYELNVLPSANNALALPRKTKIWGLRKGSDGKFKYGFLDLRDEPQNDPEWEEYLRLKEKFNDTY